jgi:hypothetical protein
VRSAGKLAVPALIAHTIDTAIAGDHIGAAIGDSLVIAVVGAAGAFAAALRRWWARALLTLLLLVLFLFGLCWQLTLAAARADEHTRLDARGGGGGLRRQGAQLPARCPGDAAPLASTIRNSSVRTLSKNIADENGGPRTNGPRPWARWPSGSASGGW